VAGRWGWSGKLPFAMGGAGVGGERNRREASVRREPGEPRSAANPRLGYRFAALNAGISGFAIVVNSVGVKMFPDSTLYTTLKNGLVGVVFGLVVLLGAQQRQEVARLTRQQWGALALIALVAGSLAYALYFRGLQISTPATAAVIDHTQFLLVAVFAAGLLRERASRTVVVALIVLAAGLVLGVGLRTVRMDAGVPYLIAGTVLLAVGVILIKAALRTVSVVTIVAGKMTLGSALLVAYLAAAGRLGGAFHLSSLQWAFLAVTGFLLLAFTLTEVVGLRYASATGVTAVSASAPILTTLLVVLTRGMSVSAPQLLGAGMVLGAVLAIYAVGSRQDAGVVDAPAGRSS